MDTSYFDRSMSILSNIVRSGNYCRNVVNVGDVLTTVVDPL